MKVPNKGIEIASTDRMGLLIEIDLNVKILRITCNLGTLKRSKIKEELISDQIN